MGVRAGRSFRLWQLEEHPFSPLCPFAVTSETKSCCCTPGLALVKWAISSLLTSPLRSPPEVSSGSLLPPPHPHLHHSGPLVLSCCLPSRATRELLAFLPGYLIHSVPSPTIPQTEFHPPQRYAALCSGQDTVLSSQPTI